MGEYGVRRPSETGSWWKLGISSPWVDLKGKVLGVFGHCHEGFETIGISDKYNNKNTNELEQLGV